MRALLSVKTGFTIGRVSPTIRTIDQNLLRVEKALPLLDRRRNTRDFMLYFMIPYIIMYRTQPKAKALCNHSPTFTSYHPPTPLTPIKPP